MDNSNIDPSDALKEELKKEIKKRKKYEFWDLRLSHLFLWLSVLASFSSAIIIAAGDIRISKIWVAIIAGIPGLIVIIERTFDFARRSAWGTLFKIEIQELQDDLSFGKIDSHLASKKFREICRKHETIFLTIGSFVKENDAESGENKQDDTKLNGKITQKN